MSEKKMKLTRRQLLTGAGLAVGGAALAVPLSTDRLLDAKYPKVPSNKVELPPNGKSVLIIGGGLAGMQAGVEMSARGFKVTVLEKSGTPGGKLKTWRDKSFGPADDPVKQEPGFKGYVREHGIHAIWGFYNNLREFMGRYGWELFDLPEGYSMYTFLDRNRAKSHMPVTSLPPPYNRLEQILQPMELGHVAPTERNVFFRALAKLATFDYTDPEQRAYLDGMTLEAWCKQQGLPDGVTYKLFDSMVEMAYFDNVQHVSALSLAVFIQLLAGSPEDLKINLYMKPPGETFVEPMAAYIESRGGAIHYNTEVTHFETAGGRITGVTAAAVNREVFRRCAICGGIIFGDQELEVCPHCGAEAAQIKQLSSEERAERRFTADYYVSALDIRGAQGVIQDNLAALGGGAYFENILKLHPKLVYVVNLWIPGTGFWNENIHDVGDRPTYNFFATGFEQLGITINWSLPLRGTGKYMCVEYEGRDISIIETQIAKAEQVAHLSNREIADLCHAELRQVMPEIPPYRSYFVNRWTNYNGYRVGSEGLRPAIQSPIDNLLFIGDMPFTPHPAIFMEKTNVTAKGATNLLLDKIGQREGKITILHSGTPSLAIKALRQATSVKA